MAMPAVHFVLLVIFPAAMAYAAASDLLTQTLSNRLTVGLALVFVVFAVVAGMDWQTFGLHLVAGAAVLAIGFTCFAMGWVGGGDAKLAATIALWVGLHGALEFVLLASLFGGALTLLLLAFRRNVVPVFVIRQPWVQRLHQEGAGVPYGIALAAAGIAVYPHTVLLQMAGS